MSTVVTEPVCVSDFEPYLQRRVDDLMWQYYRSGADGEHTLRDNTLAYQKYRLRPRCLRDVSKRDMRTSILGHQLDFPIGVSPTATHGYIHPDGEIATARGISAADCAMILSMWSNKRLEDVAAVVRPNTPLFMQLNLLNDKKRLIAIVRRAEMAGFKAFVVTIDQSVLGNRRSFRDAGIETPPHIQFPQSLYPGETYTQQTADILISSSATWDYIVWLRGLTSLPIIVKGITTAENAQAAVKSGVAGILVSNHGGRQLDGVPATIDALSEVAEVVRGSNVEVYLDGGVRKGTDILKAIALGARAVFIGRPALWGLAYHGDKGVQKVLEILKEELSLAMALTGCSSLEDITPDLITTMPFCRL